MLLIIKVSMNLFGSLFPFDLIIQAQALISTVLTEADDYIDDLQVM